MGEEDWDLFAVVRGCVSAPEQRRKEDPLACLASLTFEDEADADYPFSFPNLTPPPPTDSGVLQDSFKPFLPNPNTSSTGFRFSGRHNQPPPPPPLSTTTTNIGLIKTTTSDPVFVFGQSRNYPQKPMPEFQLQRPHDSAAAVGRTLALHAVQSPGPKSRKRKNHQKKTVCHVTADSLSADPWAWRKYGQKPIKGSPYPRNYYRCSSSKGCVARKQVERSNSDPNIFIVTYTGDHTHPKPTHRNSLAGSTRNKLSSAKKSGKNPAAAAAAAETAADASCSPPLSGTSVSPTTPLPGPDEDAGTGQEFKGSGDGDGDDAEMAEEESDEDDYLLIPDVKIEDDLFEGLKELAGGMGQSPPFGDDFSWGGGGSATSETTAVDGY